MDGLEVRWDGQRLSLRNGRSLLAPRTFTESLKDIKELTGAVWYAFPTLGKTNRNTILGFLVATKQS